MQRKNSILKTTSRHRSGIAMIMAIAVIVIISTIMALSISLSTQTTKSTTDIYLYEQAILYAKSAQEFALLNIAKNGCTNTYNYTFGNAGEIQYDANVTMSYIYSAPVTGCTQYITIKTPEQNGSVLMDVSVTLHDPSISSEPIRYFKRTIEKL